MLIVPAYCAKSYDYNDLVERDIARIICEIAKVTVSDYGIGIARPEFDFKLDGVPFELKTSMKNSIPVELYKDDEETIPSGLLTSTSPFVITLSIGHRSNVGEVGKLRVFKRKSLIAAALRSNKRVFFPGSTPSQGAVVYTLPMDVTRDLYHVWFGDIPIIEFEPGKHAYDTDNMFPGSHGAELKGHIHEYLESYNDQQTSTNV